jgi:hypothetical protein
MNGKWHLDLEEVSLRPFEDQMIIFRCKPDAVQRRKGAFSLDGAFGELFKC